MSDTQGNAGDGTEGTGAPATQSNSAEPTPEIKGYQKVVAKKDAIITELAQRLAQYEGAPTVEQQLEFEKQARQAAETSLAVERAKAKAPEFAGVIEALAERGTVPDDALINELRSSVKTSAPRESSGLRNSPATATPTPSDKFDEILKNGKVFE